MTANFGRALHKAIQQGILKANFKVLFFLSHHILVFVSSLSFCPPSRFVSLSCLLVDMSRVWPWETDGWHRSSV